MAQQTDEELIRETLAGKEHAFAELVRRYERRVAVTIRSVVGELSQEDLADIAQDIFLLAFKGLPSFRGEAQFGTWLTRIALRHCYRESKRRRKKRSIFQYFESRQDDNETPETRIPGTSKTDAGIMAGERHSEVIAALQELPEEFRTVLVLRVIEEMPVEEVAESLGISTGTVKSRLYRAKEKMRELLANSELEFQYNLE
jgi:RNA polymerase sigma-70 factor (ECF subfamily)